MNKQQALVVMRMLTDPRLPLELGDIFSEAILYSPGIPFTLTDEKLGVLSRYLPDLVLQYRDAEG